MAVSDNNQISAITNGTLFVEMLQRKKGNLLLMLNKWSMTIKENSSEDIAWQKGKMVGQVITCITISMNVPSCSMNRYYLHKQKTDINKWLLHTLMLKDIESERKRYELQKGFKEKFCTWVAEKLLRFVSPCHFNVVSAHTIVAHKCCPQGVSFISFT